MHLLRFCTATCDRFLMVPRKRVKGCWLEKKNTLLLYKLMDYGITHVFGIHRPSLTPVQLPWVSLKKVYGPFTLWQLSLASKLPCSSTLQSAKSTRQRTVNVQCVRT